MRLLIIYIFGLFLLATSCGQVDKQDKKEPAILIYNDILDTVTIKFNQAIMELPEFKRWEYYDLNNDTTMTMGHAHFEKRKVISKGNVFYHIELLRQKFNKLTDSFMYPEEVVCYFRVYPPANNILILNTKTKQFIDLLSEEGRQYFKDCLAK